MQTDSKYKIKLNKNIPEKLPATQLQEKMETDFLKC